LSDCPRLFLLLLCLIDLLVDLVLFGIVYYS